MHKLSAYGLCKKQQRKILLPSHIFQSEKGWFFNPLVIKSANRTMKVLLPQVVCTFRPSTWKAIFFKILLRMIVADDNALHLQEKNCRFRQPILACFEKVYRIAHKQCAGFVQNADKSVFVTPFKNHLRFRQYKLYPSLFQIVRGILQPVYGLMF